MRSVGVSAALTVKREPNQPQKEDEKEKPDEPTEPEDTVEISATVPEIEEHDDGPDQFWITVEAAADLLEQHKDIYPAIEYQQLNAHVVYLRNNKIDRLYWPPSLTFAAALTEAATPAPEPETIDSTATEQNPSDYDLYS